MWPRMTMSRCEAYDENLNVGLQRIKRKICHLFVVNAVIRLCGLPRWLEQMWSTRWESQCGFTMDESKYVSFVCGQCGQQRLEARVYQVLWVAKMTIEESDDQFTPWLCGQCGQEWHLADVKHTLSTLMYLSEWATVLWFKLYVLHIMSMNALLWFCCDMLRAIRIDQSSLSHSAMTSIGCLALPAWEQKHGLGM